MNTERVGDQVGLHGRLWTEAELAILRTEWVKGTCSNEIVKMLPGRSETAVRRQASTIGLLRPADWRRRWQPNPNPYKESTEMSWRAWCVIQNDKFVKAMLANPTERPSNGPLPDDGPMARRTHPIHLPLTSCSLEMV